MLRSLFTGISGLDAHQQMLDVTANNIANVNTTGYKSSSTVFEDTLSQTLSGAGATAASTGGTNATQVGLGVKLAATNLDFTQGASQPTGVPSNMLINNDGFFMVTKGGTQMYTRAGAFELDESGHLVAPDGAEVEGTDGKVLDLSALHSGDYVSYSIGQDGTISGIKRDSSTVSLGQVGLATFPNPEGLTKVGDSEFVASASSGAADVGAPGTGSRGTISSGYVEMSNVDLSKELTNLIIAQRGFQANSKVITTSDQILDTLVNLKQ
ncbi:flagellar hook-basal body complex protein [uncultured Jatrophihabitans sp.]|uniref:flagellar hook-basal body complex protein n=1 Tax=uncultured Jatrophihabitans sp. TaxID=1610747 RepID=UPI0035CBEAF2